MSQNKDLARRLHNLEIAFVGLHSLVKDCYPKEAGEKADALFQNYFGASSSVGAFRSNQFKGRTAPANVKSVKK